MKEALVACSIAALCMISSGCEAEDAVSDAGDAPGDGAPSDPETKGGGCASDDDCPNDGWCAGPEGCDATWDCQEEIPCSAAPPFKACTCAGVWRTLAPGCPQERYAYVHPGGDEPEDGAPCDIFALPP